MQLSGKVAFITGADSGIGFETAKALLQKGAFVIFGCSPNPLSRPVKKLLHSSQSRAVSFDLADLQSIVEVAGQLKQEHKQLDILVNNAGVMEPDYSLTQQGFEYQFGVNHIGHFALTGMLIDHFPSIGRVVTVSSLAANNASLNLSITQQHANYNRSVSYAQSKLANLLFSYDLDRYFKEKGLPGISVAVHPGYSRTNLQRHVRDPLRKLHVLYTQMTKAQSARSGAMTALRAVTDTSLSGGEYIVPNSRNQLTGKPMLVEHPARAFDKTEMTRLWKFSVAATGITYPS